MKILNLILDTIVAGGARTVFWVAAAVAVVHFAWKYW